MDFALPDNSEVNHPYTDEKDCYYLLGENPSFANDSIPVCLFALPKEGSDHRKPWRLPLRALVQAYLRVVALASHRSI